MNIRLISDPKPFCFDPPYCCLQTRQMERERIFDNENANKFLIPASGSNDRYRSVTLPRKVTAFFLSVCRQDWVIPLQSNDRIYVVDDEACFPPGLAECAIELRKKNIWVVQKVLRASRQVRGNELTRKRCDCCEISLPIKVHDSLDNSILPNTRDELKETFQANASSSPLCALMTSHPELIHRCVSEGIFYAGRPKWRGNDEKELRLGEFERLMCAFCKNRRIITINEIRELTNLQSQDRQAVKARLIGKIEHDNACRFREFLNDNVLLAVSDLAGNIIHTQMYYIADPALETTGNSDDSEKSCSYTRVFVMADTSEQERHHLVISHDQINQLIYQQHLETLRTRSHEGTDALTTALQNYEQMLHELPPRYQRLYDDSELNRAVTSYRNTLQRLPGPVTRLQQEVLDFMADADARFRPLYVASKQLTHLLPLTRRASAGVLTILAPKISELVAQYQQAMHAVHGQIMITNLTTLVPYELWSDCALREIGEVGNEVLGCLNRLNIDDNELHLALMVNQLNIRC